MPYELLHLPPAFHSIQAMQEINLLDSVAIPKGTTSPQTLAQHCAIPESTSIPQQRFLPVITFVESQDTGNNFEKPNELLEVSMDLPNFFSRMTTS